MGVKTLVPFFCLVSLCLAGNAWFTQFKPSQEYWVGPGVAIGTGAGTKDEPFSFSSASAKQNGEGKLYWLLPGNYTSETSNFIIECSGKLNRPCVFRCVENHKCWFQGVIEIRANEAWLWGVRISDTTGSSSSLCPIAVGSTPPIFFLRIHIINNLIEGNSRGSGKHRYGMCFSNDIGTVVYGNIVYGEGPNLNISNSYSVGSYKYVVANMFIDPSSGTPNVNAVVDSDTDGMGEISGLYFAKNIFYGGDVVLGSIYNRPDYQNVFLSNQLVNSNLYVGQDQPGQFQVLENKIFDSTISWPRMWGVGEEQFPERQQLVSAFKGNTVYRSYSAIGDLVTFGTGIYVPLPGEDDKYFVRDVDIPADTVWDANTYNFFSAAYHCHGVLESQLASDKWSALTRVGGNRFDVNSLFNVTRPPQQWFVVANEYDFSRVYLSFIIDSARRSLLVNYDLCCFLQSASWKMYDYRDIGINDIPTATSDDTDCQTVPIEFNDTSARFFVLVSEEDITNLERCPTGTWITDSEYLQITVTPPESTGVDSSTLISAIVGGLVFAIVITISVLFYRQKHKFDLEWKAEKERQLQEMESDQSL